MNGALTNADCHRRAGEAFRRACNYLSVGMIYLKDGSIW
jgi:phosphoketolase